MTRDPLPAIVAHISAAETLHAGEVSDSGAVNTGCALADGHAVELESGGIGVLRNRVMVARM